MATAFEDPAAAFERHRPRLLALAYRLLGEAAEAEDAVQDAYLRWSAADRDAIRTPEAWLTTVVTRLCLTRLASARARRESYVGAWLPEPVLTPDPALGPLASVEQRESVSMALLVLLEQLTPPERSVFVLREAFGHPHREIAAILQLGESNAQQLYHRARARIAEEGRPRFAPATDEHRRILERFLGAAAEGDVAGLEEVLAEDVTAWTDGGGQVGAARRPVHGATKVGRYLSGLLNRAPDMVAASFGHGLVRAYVMEVNAETGLVFTLDDRVIGVLVPHLHDGRVAAVHFAVNPDKLTFLARQWADTPHDAPLWSARV